LVLNDSNTSSTKNISPTKNYQNQLMCIHVIASQSWYISETQSTAEKSTKVQRTERRGTSTSRSEPSLSLAACQPEKQKQLHFINIKCKFDKLNEFNNVHVQYRYKMKRIIKQRRGTSESVATYTFRNAIFQLATWFLISCYASACSTATHRAWYCSCPSVCHTFRQYGTYLLVLAYTQIASHMWAIF